MVLKVVATDLHPLLVFSGCFLAALHCYNVAQTTDAPQLAEFCLDCKIIHLPPNQSV